MGLKNAFHAAGLQIDGGGYPLNASESDAWAAAFARGSSWAYNAAISGRPVVEGYLDDLQNGTIAGDGEAAGWNAGARVVAGWNAVEAS